MAEAHPQCEQADGKLRPWLKSKVWAFFKENKTTKQVKCAVCNAQLAYHGSTTAMHEHLKRQHPGILASTDKDGSKQRRVDHFVLRRGVCTPQMTNQYSRGESMPSDDMHAASPARETRKPGSTLDSLLGCDTDSDDETDQQESHEQLVTNEVLMYFAEQPISKTQGPLSQWKLHARTEDATILDVLLHFIFCYDFWFKYYFGAEGGLQWVNDLNQHFNRFDQPPTTPPTQLPHTFSTGQCPTPAALHTSSSTEQCPTLTALHTFHSHLTISPPAHGVTPSAHPCPSHLPR
ncbi:uncharacterized protein LOC121186018 [Toxotes jaculatrix]|uniref:uncharacterized protein LOC121186018 n=1 Tax=Toxotes jaculatrix TaxID=941984 RepID=UPI001B3AAB9A|nr:uncharacterized protein LOC121186018 [Toxotes jaculatrix]